MNINPKQIAKNMLGINNPKEMVMQALAQQGNNNPILNNLVDMANKNDYAGVEQFARNLYKGNGKDFDAEFNAFMQKMGMK